MRSNRIWKVIFTTLCVLINITDVCSQNNGIDNYRDVIRRFYRALEIYANSVSDSKTVFLDDKDIKRYLSETASIQQDYFFWESNDYSELPTGNGNDYINGLSTEIKKKEIKSIKYELFGDLMMVQDNGMVTIPVQVTAYNRRLIKLDYTNLVTFGFEIQSDLIKIRSIKFENFKVVPDNSAKINPPIKYWKYFSDYTNRVSVGAPFMWVFNERGAWDVGMQVQVKKWSMGLEFMRPNEQTMVEYAPQAEEGVLNVSEYVTGHNDQAWLLDVGFELPQFKDGWPRWSVETGIGCAFYESHSSLEEKTVSFNGSDWVFKVGVSVIPFSWSGIDLRLHAGGYFSKYVPVNGFYGGLGLNILMY